MSAPAGALGVGVEEDESFFLNGVDEIKLQADQIGEAVGIDQNLPSLRFKQVVVFLQPGLFQLQIVGLGSAVPGAPLLGDSDSQGRISGDILLFDYVSEGADRRGQGHVNIYVPVFLELNFINQPQIDDVDVDFRVVNLP